MGTAYSPTPMSKTQKAFNSYYNTDINAFVSAYLKGSVDKSKRLTYETATGSMFVRSFLRYVVGSGLVPMASPERTFLSWTDSDADRFQKEAEAYFRLMSDKGLDADRDSNFMQLQRVAFYNMLISGDVLLHRFYASKATHYRPQVQVISGSWVRSPNGMVDTKECTAGVRFYGSKQLGYYITQTDENRMDTGNCKFYSKYARNGFEEFSLVKWDKAESNQVRGIPFLTPIEGDLVDLATFETATDTKALINALYTVFVQPSEETGKSNFMEATREAAVLSSAMMEEEPQDDVGEYALGSGIVCKLAPGEDVKLVEGQLPSASYDSYMETKLTKMGGAVEVPFEMATQSYKASFSASRATVTSAEKSFKIYRNMFAERFCKPIWDFVVDHGIRTGMITAPGYLDSDLNRKCILACSWIAPSPVVIDPSKEVSAAKTAIDLGIASREEFTRTIYNRDGDETFERIANEERKRRELGIAGESVTADEPVIDTEREDEERDE